MRRCGPVGPARRVGGEGVRAPRRRDDPSPHGGAGPAPGARDGLALPPSRSLRGTQRPGGRQRRSGGLRARVPLRCSPAVRPRGAAARRRPGQRDPTRCPWLLFAGRVGRGDARRDPCGADGHRPAQPGDAADPRRELRPRRRHRPRGRGRRSALRARRRTIGDIERRIGEHVAEPDPGRRDASSSGSARSRPRPRSPCADTTISGSTPRCSPTPSSTSWKRAS